MPGVCLCHCRQTCNPWGLPRSLRPIHTRGFAPGACSSGTLREQSSSVCTNDFMGILHPREQNFHPAKCSTIFNRLNIWEQAPGANWANLKTLPRVYWHMQNEPGACYGSKTPRLYRPLTKGASEGGSITFIVCLEISLSHLPTLWKVYFDIFLTYCPPVLVDVNPFS